MKKLFWTIFVLTIFVKTYAVNQYIDPSFSGTSKGTINEPWTSFSLVNWSTLNAGDTIFLRRDRVYTSGQISFNKSGTASAPIVVMGYGTGAKPHFWGNGTTLQYLFQLQGRSYIIMDGLRFADTTIGVNDRNRISNVQRAIGAGTYTTVRNCDFDRCGLAIFFTQPFNRMENCNVRNMRMIVNTRWIDTNGDGIRQSSEPQAEDDYGANGVVISSSGNTITGCTFIECYATSQDYTWDGGGIELFGPNADDNVITYNTFSNNNGELECGSNSGGSQDNNLVAYNRYINNGSFMLVQNSNLFTTTVNNMQVFNNVIIQNLVGVTGQSSAMMRFRNNPTGTGLIVFRNNIVYITTGIPWTRSGQLTGAVLTRSNNIYMVSGGSVVNYTLNGTEATGTFATMWESTLGPALSWNLTPGPSSQAINFGTPVGFTKDFNGKNITGNPDAGIIERQAVVREFKTYLKFVP